MSGMGLSYVSLAKENCGEWSYRRFNFGDFNDSWAKAAPHLRKTT
jgi:hypothetical protein